MGSKEITRRTQQAGVPARLTLADLQERAALVVEAGLAPKGMTPAEVAVIMLKGQEEGLRPMESLQSIYVVNQRPSEMTHYLVHRLKQHGHSYVVKESTAERCTIDFYRQDGQKLPPFTMTFKECAEAHYHENYNRKTGKWQTKATWKGAGQRTMLRYRTLATGIRAYFPEVLHEPLGETQPIRPEIEGEQSDLRRLLTERIKEEGPEPVIDLVWEIAESVEARTVEEPPARLQWTQALVDAFTAWLEEHGLTPQEALDLAALHCNVEPPDSITRLPIATYGELLDAIMAEIPEGDEEPEPEEKAEEGDERLL